MKIPVKISAKYTGKKDGRWTEELTKVFVLKEAMIFVHKSHKPIKAFKSEIITCVYDEVCSEKQLSSLTREEVVHLVIEDRTHIVRPDNDPEYVYTMKVPAGTRIEEYGNEYRFVMSADVDIRLVGTMGTMIVTVDEKIASVYGRPSDYTVTRKLINVFTEKY